MNWGALIKQLLAGAVNGFLGVAGASEVFGWDVNGLQLAGGAAMIGAIRAAQEYLTPTSYVRPVESGTLSETLAGGKK